ncbi:MAG: hypothetical protein IJ189_05095 [Clostridia bacterium]|nr:hypothetical protein [Clostridia bacterium]
MNMDDSTFARSLEDPKKYMNEDYLTMLCLYFKLPDWMTYRNLMAVIRKIEAKGYDFQESERLARHIIAEFESRPQGMSIEKRVRRVLTREEWERENRECGW